MNLLLVKLLFCFISPLLLSFNKTTIPKTNNVVLSEEVVEKNDTLQNTLIGSSVGLVAIGGVGAGIIAHNNNKPKDVPIKEIKNTKDENREDEII